VTKLYYAQGDIAKVHQPLFCMTTDEESSTNEVAPVVEVKSTVPAESLIVPTNNTETALELEDFILPDIGEGIVECELVEWLVKEGDTIVEDQPIADVMTDKALVQIPAMHNGTVTKLYYAKGDIAKVHAPLFQIEKLSANGNQAAAVVETTAVTATCAVAKKVAVAANTANVEQKVAQKVVNGKAVASPAVRRVARELNVNIHEIPGSGKKGRIYKEDVVSFTNTPVATAEKVTQVAAPESGGKRVEAIRGIKAVMAKAMVRSVSTIPHFTYCEEIDMTNLMALRSGMKEAYAKQDIKLTMMPFFMKSISLALKEFPIVNTQVNDDCTEITYFDDHNIGMAVDSKVGLLVPNVKQVQNKSIVDVAKEIMRLTDSARSGRVAAADLKGGTITISNIGAIGGTIATPIINKPESAIVALGKLQKLPRFNDKGEVEARYIMQVSWSGDHRIIDGGSIARFCNLWKSFLEEPSNMLMHMS
ncbi:MAG: dihydrolipoyllysine-residue acetyltransferase, partial [Colwellia sp.]|nr:dihydrolipoyllysine-residue acetyltransferase [Colwellia sp.]